MSVPAFSPRPGQAPAGPPLPTAPGTRGERTLRPLESPPRANRARRRRPTLAYAVLALVGAGAIGLTQIAVSSATTRDSYVLAELSAQQRDLTLQTQAARDELHGLSSPQRLAANAAALGMVVGGSPLFLRLSDGAIVGTGGEAGWSSTINPNGRGAVANALLTDATPGIVPGATAPAPEDGASAPPASDLPPALTEGLPSPTTR